MFLLSYRESLKSRYAKVVQHLSSEESFTFCVNDMRVLQNILKFKRNNVIIIGEIWN